MSSLYEATAVQWDSSKEPSDSPRGFSNLQSRSMGLRDLKEVLSASYQTAVAAAVHGTHTLSQLLQRLRTHSPLQDVAWIQTLVDECGYEKVIDKAKLLARGDLFPEDHLFKNMARSGMLLDNTVLFKAGPTQPQQEACSHSCEVVAVYQMGLGACGHAGIVHGGMTSALIDETCGYLLYLARSQGVLDFKAVLTASLEVQFKQPLTPDRPVVITAYITELQGRKIWVEVQVTDLPLCMTSTTSSPASSTSSLASGDTPSRPVAKKLYATGKALFIIPRQGSASLAALEQASQGHTVLGAKLTKDHGYPADV